MNARYQMTINAGGRWHPLSDKELRGVLRERYRDVEAVIAQIDAGDVITTNGRVQFRRAPVPDVLNRSQSEHDQVLREIPKPWRAV